jgi:hypothetical protein
MKPQFSVGCIPAASTELGLTASVPFQCIIQLLTRLSGTANNAVDFPLSRTDRMVPILIHVGLFHDSLKAVC